MKYILHFIGTIMLTAICSLIAATMLGVLRYLGYLLSWVEKPTLVNILWMALILWAIMLLRGVISVIAFMYHCWKDPYFKQATFQTGISWKEYKRFKEIK